MSEWVLGKFSLTVKAGSLQEHASFPQVLPKAVTVNFPLGNGPGVDPAGHPLGKAFTMRLEPLLLGIFIGNVTILFKCPQQGMAHSGRPK